MEMISNSDHTVTVRIKESGQVIDMVPAVARELLNSGFAEQPEFVKARAQQRPESAMVAPRGERAVAPAQAGPTKRERKTR